LGWMKQTSWPAARSERRPPPKRRGRRNPREPLQSRDTEGRVTRCSWGSSLPWLWPALPRLQPGAVEGARVSRDHAGRCESSWLGGTGLAGSEAFQPRAAVRLGRAPRSASRRLPPRAQRADVDRPRRRGERCG
jgi:hypothetical protein